MFKSNCFIKYTANRFYFTSIYIKVNGNLFPAPFRAIMFLVMIFQTRNHYLIYKDYQQS